MIKEIIAFLRKYLRKFIDWLRMLFTEVGNNMISVIIIFLFYFILWEFPQTIDLLLIFNQVDSERIQEIPIYYALLVLLGSIMWIGPLYFDPRVYRKMSVKGFFAKPPQVFGAVGSQSGYSPVYYRKMHIQKTVPKLLGCLLIIISSLGVLNAFEVSEGYSPLNISASNIFLFTLIFFLLLLVYPVYRFIRKLLLLIPGSKISVPIILFLIVVGIVLLGVLNRQDQEDVLKLFFSNSLLALLFLAFTFLFRKIGSDATKTWIFRALLGLIIVALAAYLCFAFYTPFARRLNPLLIVLISLIAFQMLAFVLKFTGKKYKVPLVTIFIILCFFAGESIASNNSFNHFAIEPIPDMENRISIEEHIENWFNTRKGAILSADKDYPVILVSAEGGGSRAGLWSFLVHSYLHEQYPAYFSKHLFSLTGASGGGVGNAMYYVKASEVMRTNEDFSFLAENGNSNGYMYRASELYSENFLSTSISGLLGRDLFQSIFDFFTFDDRGRLLEEQWEEAHYEHVSDFTADPLLGRAFLSYFDQQMMKKSPPLLIINTTHIQTGQYALVSPVSFDTINELPGFKDLIFNFQEEYPDATFRLSTAMSLTARFPYISPVARVSGIGQFADAGYYDNIGGGVTKGLKDIIEAEWEKFKEKDSLIPADKGLNVVQLLIKNEEQVPGLKYSTQLRAPLTALLNVRSGHTREMKEHIGDEWAINLKRTPIPPPEELFFSLTDKSESQDTTTITPILPLGRYMSRVAILSMEKRLENPVVKDRLDSLVTLMKEFKQE